MEKRLQPQHLPRVTWLPVETEVPPPPHKLRRGQLGGLAVAGVAFPFYNISLFSKTLENQYFPKGKQ